MYLVKCECDNLYPSDLDKCPKCDAPDWARTTAPINPRDYVFDLETYPNTFTCKATHLSSGTRHTFEISDRVNQIEQFIAWVRKLGAENARMVGYNNVGFDYPVVHFIVMNPWVTAVEIYDKAMSIIKSRDKFGHLIWDSDRIVEQLDLYKVHHFDNPAKATSLKALEIAMRMDNVEDLPFDVGLDLNDEQKDVLLTYNEHDVEATSRFYARSITAIELREQLSKTFGRNFMNMSDVKMGEVILVTEIEKAGIPCYERINGRRQPRQTHRARINLGEVIFPYVRFERPEFEAIRAHLATQTITETKGVFNGLIATVDGLDYKFGTGGLHASVDGQIFESNDTHQIIDVDVASYYPNLAIMNRLYPAHLGEAFCDAYEGVYKTRKSYPKSRPENGAYKLALNGAYGGSNNEYSPFYDPKYTMGITINGQLLLCMLVEQMLKVPGLKMIQANTDGITYYCPREYIEHTRNVCKWWEKQTKLELEEAQYTHMMVRDVNSYMAVYDSGKIKRIGAYAYERADENPATREVPYNKDPSALIVPKAAEAALVHDKDIEQFIRDHKDPYDFMLRAKVPRSNNLVMRWPEWDTELKLPSILRYYVSTNGGSLTKVAPPTGKAGTWKRKSGITDTQYNAVMAELRSYIDQLDAMGGIPRSGQIEYEGKVIVLDTDGIPHDERIHTKNKSKHQQREMSIARGWLVTDCSNAANFDWSTVNYDYYVSETRKLVDSLVKAK